MHGNKIRLHGNGISIERQIENPSTFELSWSMFHSLLLNADPNLNQLNQHNRSRITRSISSVVNVDNYGFVTVVCKIWKPNIHFFIVIATYTFLLIIYRSC